MRGAEGLCSGAVRGIDTQTDRVFGEAGKNPTMCTRRPDTLNEGFISRYNHVLQPQNVPLSNVRSRSCLVSSRLVARQLAGIKERNVAAKIDQVCARNRWWGCFISLVPFCDVGTSKCEQHATTTPILERNPIVAVECTRSIAARIPHCPSARGNSQHNPVIVVIV